MSDLELTRAKDDRRLYALEGVGTLRLEGLVASTATAEARGRSWRFARRLFRRFVDATDPSGTVVGEFSPRSLRRGGSIVWRGRDYELRPAAAFRERYALVDGERELALYEGKSWGRRPVRVTVADGASIDPGLLLFTAYVVRGLASDASAAAGAASSTAATSG